MFKIIKIVKRVIFFVVIIFFIFFILSRGKIYKKSELEYGVTFSKKQADSLELDWKKVYISIMDDLGVKKIRIIAYWDEIENKNNNFQWNDLDWQIQEAKKRNVKIILSIGGRLPRWPECHFPDWTKKLTKKEKEKETLEYIKKTINRYKDNNNIIAWQIENEPFLSHFGKCPKLDKKFLDKEISLTKNLDNKPVIITDSGELSFWILAAKRADIFGTTMYRDTYSHLLKQYIHYPITPGFFRFKKNIARIFAKPKKWIVIELQAEPWGPVPYQELTKQERNKTMSLKKFQEIIDFSQKTGFKEFYLWGVEWWYWENVYNNDMRFLEEAKALF